ncbi:MAG: divergent polysaccharide deacetylase family protein [Rhodospirillales bacterium]
MTADTIDARLAVLEHLAAVHGAAIGLAGPPKPVLLERIAVWARGLAARGITLSPVTAMPPTPQ